jgi:vacuolar-type H+-ATPase subunit I/STV1
MSVRSSLMARIEKLEKLYDRKRAEEEEKRNALASSMESGGSEEIASSLTSLQTEIRSMEEVIKHKKEEMKSIEEYSTTEEAKADRSEMNKPELMSFSLLQKIFTLQFVNMMCWRKETE